jgi:hypothetical protein
MSQLQAPPLPEACRHLYRWFLELSFARGSNGWGPNPIRYVDMAAWAELTGTFIRPGEVRAILRLDQVYLTEMASRGKKPGKPDDKPKPRK